ncbi:65-kDa microtubule-associated protein 5 [Vitis vinifera]|uniref:65-kDa microtubule-associated protein 5 n=1 Tax=Vitis vinifera TaxID=29760 RepID=A0A438BVX8_VITVI|nr:65-kDa microtubule-associated protein 5 [Vitis vinifera]
MLSEMWGHMEGRLQDLGSTLMELWNLLDTSVDEQKQFKHVTCLISSSIDEVVRQGCLALDVIEQTEVEIERLKVLKASKMKELVLKRQNELEEIYRGVHMDLDTDAARQTLVSLIDSGNVDLSDLLSGIDDQIVKAKEQALSRKDILDKVEKWKYASDEENWLDDYERKDFLMEFRSLRENGCGGILGRVQRCGISLPRFFQVYSVHGRRWGKNSVLGRLVVRGSTSRVFPTKLVWNSQVPFKIKSFVWLVAHKKDENRYSAGRGAHKNLKRAEKARILVSKIPCELDAGQCLNSETAACNLSIGGPAF